MTGGRFTTGHESKVAMVPRSGPVVTQRLTQKARTKVRRAIQNAPDLFRCFMTVTFSPSHLKPWHLDENGRVRQDYAKEKFKKFLHSIKVARDRKAKASGNESDKIAYVWVAEIQQETTGNVHFHVLLNHRLPIAWLTKLWAQANNSIDVKRIDNINHASCYIRKYMAKENSTIQGNRYGITQQLRESMKPEKKTIEGRELNKHIFEIIEELTDTIESNGGKVLDHGFYIPTPSRSVPFKNKQGHKQKTKPVNKGLAPYLLRQVEELQNTSPF